MLAACGKKFIGRALTPLPGNVCQLSNKVALLCLLSGFCRQLLLLRQLVTSAWQAGFAKKRFGCGLDRRACALPPAELSTESWT